MPIYPIQCTACPFRGDILARVSECQRLKCPECGSRAEQDYTQKRVSNGNREFHGEKAESITEFYHSTEVNEARQALGTSGHCVQRDGSVRFKDRQEQRRYLKDKWAMKQRFSEGNAKKREKALKG